MYEQIPPFTKLIEKGMSNDSVLIRNERECKIVSHKFQGYKKRKRKNASHGLTTLTSFANAYRVFPAAFAATSPGEMTW